MKASINHLKPISQFIVISYAFSWLVWLPGVLSSRGLMPELPWLPFFAVGTFGPLVAAVWLLKKEGGWQKVSKWLRKGFFKKIEWQWWLLIFTIPLLLPPMALLIFVIGGGGEVAEIPFFNSPWIILPTFLLMVIMGGGNEEFGWRGFLLPRLLEKLSPWQADLVLIPIHAFWHLPLFFNTNTIQSTYPFWLFLVFGIGFTPMINRVFRGTRNSILAAILFHALVNTGLDIFPPVGSWVNNSPFPLILIGILFGLSAMMTSSFTKLKKQKDLPL